jgi:hypothetical protein
VIAPRLLDCRCLKTLIAVLSGKGKSSVSATMPQLELHKPLS